MTVRRLDSSGVVVLVLLVVPVPGHAAQCGSALLLKTAAPAVFDGITLSPSLVARFWEAGAAGSSFSTAGCLTGCTSALGPQCAGGGDCLALTGVNWLNAICSVPGHLPARAVFLVEETTVDSGGRWAAINLDRNALDTNTDLDAKAAAVCSGCSSAASPYIGGGGRPVVTGSSASGATLTVNLSWSPPPAAAQALSNGANLVTGYSVVFRPNDAGSPPPSTGDPTGWTWTPDLEADGAAHGGFSTGTTATVDIPLDSSIESLSLAVGLDFDGSGDPGSDSNTRASAYISDASDPLPVPTPCGEPNHLVLEQQTVNTAEERVACLTISAGNDYVVGPTGNVVFRAGNSITLGNGFAVAEGGQFVAEIDAALTQY